MFWKTRQKGPRRKRGSVSWSLAFILGCGLGCGLIVMPAPLLARGLTVFAAASLKNAMDEISTRWQAKTGDRLTVSLAGSSLLARQILQGAPADIFISANRKWMDVLEKSGELAPGSRFDLLQNHLVLIAQRKAAPATPLRLNSKVDLAGMIGEGKLAMALVDAVPAGIYGKAALGSLGLWASVAPKVVQLDNVRVALALVASGEAAYGIVYASDARADTRVQVVATFPPNAHRPIVYPVAATADSRNPLTPDFLKFLRGTAARAAFERQGFVVLK